jgi:hypothetical protein
MLETIFVGGAIAAGAYHLAKAIRSRLKHSKIRSAAMALSRHAATNAQYRQAQLDAAKRQAAREMQLAIQHLHQAPDFRRAAAIAAIATRVGVPTAFRQQQFFRLRPLLIAHLARRLQEGIAMDAASAGLRELVVNLGAAAFEADYILTEAQARQRPSTPATPNYRDRLRQINAEHAQRLEAIRSTAGLEDEVREQLVEAEQERFRRELLEMPEGAN